MKYQIIHNFTIAPSDGKGAYGGVEEFRKYFALRSQEIIQLQRCRMINIMKDEVYVVFLEVN